jgi:hypothetical protein
MSSSRMSMRASTGESGIRVQPEMFKHRLLQVAEETVESLQKIWKEAGYEEIECQRLLGDLLNKMKITCAGELAAEQQILEHAKLEVDAKIDDFTRLCAQLGRVAVLQQLTPLNYSDKLAELDKLITEVSVEVSQRSKVLGAEMSLIQELCDTIGEDLPSADRFNGPEGTPELSDIRLKLMRQHTMELEKMKQQRKEEMQRIVLECKQHIADLVLEEEGFDTMPFSKQYADLDKRILKFINSKEFMFGIHKRDLTQLLCRTKSFIEEKDKRRDELAKTGAEIARLWTLLRTPAPEREKFQSSFKMNLSMATLAAGVKELERLREIRATSFGTVISSIRNDITSLWEEAGIESLNDRSNEFSMFFSAVEDLDDNAVRKI